MRKEYIVTIQKRVKVTADSKKLAEKSARDLFTNTEVACCGAGVDGYYNVEPYKRTTVISTVKK
jgi:hypothetical protein